MKQVPRGSVIFLSPWGSIKKKIRHRSFLQLNRRCIRIIIFARACVCVRELLLLYYDVNGGRLRSFRSRDIGKRLHTIILCVFK